MLTEERKEILQRIARELMLAGQKTDINLSEEQLMSLLDKSLKALQPVEAEQLLLLSSQAVNAVSQLRRPDVTEVRPQVLECDVVRFQNNKEKWVAFVGLLDGYPYEIFTGLQDDEEGIVLPKTVTKGKILKQINPDGTKRYDFQFENKRGYKTTVEGLRRSSIRNTGTMRSSSQVCYVTVCRWSMSLNSLAPCRLMTRASIPGRLVWNVL